MLTGVSCLWVDWCFLPDLTGVWCLWKVGDAHAHLKNNDCGLSNGAVYSGAKLIEHHLKAANAKRDNILRRIPPQLRISTCRLLGISAAEANQVSAACVSQPAMRCLLTNKAP